GSKTCAAHRNHDWAITLHVYGRSTGVGLGGCGSKSDFKDHVCSLCQIDRCPAAEKKKFGGRWHGEARDFYHRAAEVHDFDVVGQGCRPDRYVPKVDRIGGRSDSQATLRGCWRSQHRPDHAATQREFEPLEASEHLSVPFLAVAV